MSDPCDNFRDFWLRYRPGLERALQYLLEDASEASRIVTGTRDQAERQWVALEGEANPVHLIGLAAADQCALLLPRPAGEAPRPSPTPVQIIRHLEWYDWEQRIAALKTAVEVREASVREAGRDPQTDAELEELQTKLDALISTLFRAHLGLDEDDDTAGGGLPCPIPDLPPQRGPGERRTFREALAPARNP